MQTPLQSRAALPCAQSALQCLRGCSRAARTARRGVPSARRARSASRRPRSSTRRSRGSRRPRTSMCLRWIPSKRAPMASMAPLERSFRASVLSSTRRHVHCSKAWRSISSFASTFTPVPQTAGCSHVHPISSERCSGRRARKRVEPTTPLLVEGHERDLRPGARGGESGVDPLVELAPGRGLHDGEPAPGPRIAGRLPQPVGVTGVERLEPDEPALERRCLPRSHGCVRLDYGPCRSTSTRAWSARSTSTSSSAPSSRS